MSYASIMQKPERKPEQKTEQKQPVQAQPPKTPPCAKKTQKASDTHAPRKPRRKSEEPVPYWRRGNDRDEKYPVSHPEDAGRLSF